MKCLAMLVSALMVSAELAWDQPAKGMEGVGVNTPNPATQIHLSFTANAEDEMMVTWSTKHPASSEVRYGLAESFPQVSAVAEGYEKKFVDNGTLHHTQYMHRTVLPHLKSRTEYSYQVKSDQDWSETYTFLSGGDETWMPKISIYGDFGLKNPEIFAALQADLKDRNGDFIIHNGDFAYNMFEDNATKGDTWFEFVEPVYASKPVMTSPGNHEGMYNFLNYRERFTMPNYLDTESIYYSYDAGNTHWIAFSTELYFAYDALEDHGGVHRTFGPYPTLQQDQLEFIEKDLIEANKNREKRPWIFAYGHRPMYCSDSDDTDCVQYNNGWKDEGLERLFAKYGVDMIFEAHQHSYERLFPTFNNVVFNGTVPGEPYTNPRAPTHIVTGAGGCQENTDVFALGALGDWSAVRLAKYGYGQLTIQSDRQLLWEQFDQNRNLLDSITMVRDKHDGYPVVFD
jgi:hypothetical protein